MVTGGAVVDVGVLWGACVCQQQAFRDGDLGGRLLRPDRIRKYAISDAVCGNKRDEGARVAMGMYVSSIVRQKIADVDGVLRCTEKDGMVRIVPPVDHLT